MNAPQEVPTLGVITCISEQELDALIHMHTVDANRWGLIPGTTAMESPALYEAAVHRTRHLQELKDKLAIAREEMQQALAEAEMAQRPDTVVLQ